MTVVGEERAAQVASSFRHATALDGLRGLAVAAVVVYHLRSDLLPGGFIGVDVFFALSGFLLSALLVREVERTGRVALGAFVIRRVRRLLPATLLVLVGVLAYAATWAEPEELGRLRDHVLGALTYSINWVFIADGTTYTDVVLGASPLRHMWSLAIEEQFYVVLALGVAGLAALVRSKPERLRWWLCVGATALAGASAVWMLVLQTGDADLSRLYFGSDTRAQTMLLGVGAGAWLGERLLDHPSAISRGPSRIDVGLAVIGVGVLVLVALTASENASWMYRGGFAVVALASVATIRAALSLDRLGRALSLRPLAALGAISYGVYLWHWPVLVILDEDRLGLDGLALDMARVAITLVVATLSYVLVEQPIRRGSLGRSIGRWSLALAPLVVVIVGAAAIVVTDTSDDPALTDVVAQTPDDPALADPELFQIAALGDSVMHTLIGGSLGTGLESIPWNQAQSSFDRSEVAVTTIARPACSFLPGEVAFEEPGGSYQTADLSAPCRDWRGDIAAAAERPVSADVLIVLLTNDLEDRQIDGTIVPFGTPEWDDLLFAWLDELTLLTAGLDTDLVLLATPPRIEPNWSTPEGEREHRVREIFEIVAVANEHVSVIDLSEFVDDDPAVRYDGLHYTADGARQVATWLLPQLQEIDAG